MERFGSLMKRLMRRRESRAGAYSDTIVAPEALTPLKGSFSHENYPGDEISACLNACKEITERRISSAAIRDLHKEIELEIQRHDALREALTEFNDRAAELRRDILKLTAAARPLQEPGISLVDAKTRRAALLQQVELLQQRRDAYEAEASALEKRIQEMVLKVEALRSKTVALFSLDMPQD